MADDVAITAGAGTTIAADDISSVYYQRVKLSLGADGSAVDAVAGAGAVGTGVQRVTLASDDPAVTALQILDDLALAEDVAHQAADKGVQMLTVRKDTPAGTAGTESDYQPSTTDSEGRLWVRSLPARKIISTSYTRQANTTAYAAGDAVSNSATTPSALTFSAVARANGGSGRIIGARMLDSVVPTTKGFFELWLFAGTPVIPDTGAAFDDNVAFALPDSEIDGTNNRSVGIIQFNSWYSTGLANVCHVPGLDVPFTCNAANDDLWGLVVVRNAYQSSANSNVLTFTLEIEPD